MSVTPERIEEALAALREYADGKASAEQVLHTTGRGLRWHIADALAALREAQAENARLTKIAEAAENLIERTITDPLEIGRREVRLSVLLRQWRAVSPPADEANG